MSEEEVRKRQRTDAEPMSLLRLKQHIPVRDLRILVFEKLTNYDRQITRVAHGHTAYTLRLLYNTKEFQKDCAEHGYLSLLKRCSSGVYVNTVAKAAAFNGHLHVLQWIKESGAQFAPITARGCCLHRRDGCGCFECSSIWRGAAMRGHLHVVKWAREQFPGMMGRGTGTYEMAIAGGHTNILQWLFDNGYPCDSPDYCFRATLNRQLHVLRWLVDHGCPIRVSECIPQTRQYDIQEFLQSLPSDK
jgi:hypothetical protein